MGFNISIKGDVTKIINNYSNRLNEKASLFCEKLVEAGIPVIERNFGSFAGDSDPSHYTGVEFTNLISYARAVLKVQGKDILFIEFGAGTYWNGAVGSYPNPKAQELGMVGIGQYGLGLGKNPTWAYRDETGAKVISHGTSASMPMYKASVEMKNKMLQIAKEVFG